MAKRICFLVALGALLAATATAQDAQSVLRAAAAAMGDPGDVRSIEYSGAGWVAAPGQSFTPADDWPRFEVVNYTRTIDYANRSSSEEYVRRQGDYPPQGGGGTPLQGEQQRRFYTSGDYSWNRNGNNPVPQLGAAEVRQLDIWMSPHGFLKAAMEADDATAMSLMLEGREMTIVSFTAMGTYTVNGTINEDNLVERTQTWVANPVLGDMIYDHRYDDYQDLGGVMFPTVLHSHQGDPRLNPGHNWMEIRVTDARTYIRIRSRFVFLAAILDLYSRKVIGWALSKKIDRKLCVEALGMAIRERNHRPGCIHHSDQGVQYTSEEYLKMLRDQGFRISMSARARPGDNAFIESFFKTLKYEEVHLQDYQTWQDVLERVPYFIEEVYNQKRLHSSIGYRPPVEYEQIVNLKQTEQVT